VNKIVNFQKIYFLQKMEQKIFVPFCVLKFFLKIKRFTLVGIKPAGPTLLSLLDQMGSALNHLPIACGLFFPLGDNGLYTSPYTGNTS
jgi:hypothetical protein